MFYLFCHIYSFRLYLEDKVNFSHIEEMEHQLLFKASFRSCRSHRNKSNFSEKIKYYMVTTLNVVKFNLALAGLLKNFIIHPCDPTVVICYLIWPCDMAVHITYLISHSSSLSCHTVVKGYFRLGVYQIQNYPPLYFTRCSQLVP